VLNVGFVHLFEKCSGRSASRGWGNTTTALRLWALSVVVAGLAGFGCGSPATLHIAAPSSAVAGSPFTITVSATVGTSPDKVINSPIKFTSSDSSAVLPGIYYFVASDAGSHTFTNGVTLNTPGNQTITATVIGAPGLNASATVTVTTPTP
jgi:hypothetical protein